MNISPHDFNEQWSGLEPEQPKGPRGAFWAALLAAALLAGSICGLSAFLWQQGALAQLGLPGGTATDGPTPDPAQQPTSAAIGTLPVVVGTSAPDLAPTVTMPADLTPTVPAAQAAVIAAPRTGVPVIDGDPTEWVGIPAAQSSFVVYTAPDWNGTDDLEATWQMVWDSEYLYGLVTVIDDIHVQSQTGNLIFLGDSVDMQFDTQREADFGPAFSPDDFQITMSPGDFGGLMASAFRFQGTADGKMLDAQTPTYTRVAAQPSGSGYYLEFAIPWPDLGMTPAQGMVIGLALNASDNDSPGVAIQEMMKSNSPTRRFSDPTTWGTLTLQ